MAKYSKIYKVGKKSFRYNYDEAMLEWVSNITKKIKKDNEEWQKEFGHDMWDIVDGKVVNDRIGLMRENWKDGPEYWCGQYADEIDEECYFLAKEL